MRESLRLLTRIALAVLIAIVIAELRALTGGGDTLRTFRIVLLALGALLLLLAAAGNSSTGSTRRLNHTGWWLSESLGFRGLQEAEGPTLAPTAVFVGAGAVVIALGLVV